jgi:hypothetical protein
MTDNAQTFEAYFTAHAADAKEYTEGYLFKPVAAGEAYVEKLDAGFAMVMFSSKAPEDGYLVTKLSDQSSIVGYFNKAAFAAESFDLSTAKPALPPQDLPEGWATREVSKDDILHTAEGEKPVKAPEDGFLIDTPEGQQFSPTRVFTSLFNVAAAKKPDDAVIGLKSEAPLDGVIVKPSVTLVHETGETYTTKGSEMMILRVKDEQGAFQYMPTPSNFGRVYLRETPQVKAPVPGV